MVIREVIPKINKFMAHPKKEREVEAMDRERRGIKNVQVIIHTQTHE